MAYLLRKRFIAWLLPVVLVFVQHAALAHVVSHAADPSADPEQTRAHLKLCDECASVAMLEHVGAGQTHRFDLLHTSHGYSAALPAQSRSIDPAQHAARDPPNFL
jgi:hypothetical protein